ncbi:hypothetical protein Gorai_019526, partial [Gossypium raimondii]|nr:hypothetical protein [Gossypium raimondii]
TTNQTKAIGKASKWFAGHSASKNPTPITNPPIKANGVGVSSNPTVKRNPPRTVIEPAQQMVATVTNHAELNPSIFSLGRETIAERIRALQERVPSVNK